MNLEQIANTLKMQADPVLAQKVQQQDPLQSAIAAALLHERQQTRAASAPQQVAPIAQQNPVTQGIYPMIVQAANSLMRQRASAPGEGLGAVEPPVMMSSGGVVAFQGGGVTMTTPEMGPPRPGGLASVAPQGYPQGYRQDISDIYSGVMPAEVPAETQLERQLGLEKRYGVQSSGQALREQIQRSLARGEEEARSIPARQNAAAFAGMRGGTLGAALESGRQAGFSYREAAEVAYQAARNLREEALAKLQDAENERMRNNIVEAIKNELAAKQKLQEAKMEEAKAKVAEAKTRYEQGTHAETARLDRAQRAEEAAAREAGAMERERVRGGYHLRGQEIVAGAREGAQEARYAEPQRKAIEAAIEYLTLYSKGFAKLPPAEQARQAREFAKTKQPELFRNESAQTPAPTGTARRYNPATGRLE